MNRKHIARALAEESIVLLKNEGGLLPLHRGARVAFFGRAQEETVFSGNGSGGAFSDSCISILKACSAAGLVPEPEIAEFYREKAAEHPPENEWLRMGEKAACGLMYEIFGQYRPAAEEYALTAEQLHRAREWTDTAVLVLGRNTGGEECDRRVEDDYLLTPSEEALAEAVCAAFPRVILVLNVNGVVDLRWTERQPHIGAILFLGIPGECGTLALADILTGAVNPSGHLAFTIAERYEDYYTSAHFSGNREGRVLTYGDYGLSAADNGSTGFDTSPVTVYREDIYCGYRYFDTFGVEPLYPFGFGLSYTEFDREPVAFNWDGTGAVLRVRVRNVGSCPGRELVQLYLAAKTAQKRPARMLVGFEKTELLAPGQVQELEITVPWRELGCFNQDTADITLGAGEYLLLLGDSSRSLSAAVNVRVPETILLHRCIGSLPIRPCNREMPELLQELIKDDRPHSAPWQITLTSVDPLPAPEPPEEYPVTETLSDLQLAALCVGYGPGLPFAPFLKGDYADTLTDGSGEPLTVNSHPAGQRGYVSPAMPERGIYSVSYRDGPAGVGSTVWPTEMLLACSFSRAAWHAFGDAVGAECEEQQVDVWLAPAVNLQRSPLGGRNFEYFSEDPFLTGTAAVAVAKGVGEHHRVLVCPKHFAANEQETYRRGSLRRSVDAVDSIVSEQALREVYLRPFRMLVEQADIRCIMTSFNRINGTFAAGSRELCTKILREEWGFRGAVITDWGDMDVVVDGADAVAAGNDILMPGGPPVIRQILKGLDEGRVTRRDLICAVNHLLSMTSRTRSGMQMTHTGI